MGCRVLKADQFTDDKILCHPERLSEWYVNGDTRPVTYELDITNACTHHCPYCVGFYDKEGHRESLNIEEIKDIINQISGFCGKAVTFTGGGDPACNSALSESVEYAKVKGLDVGIITNGSLLHRTNMELLVKNCSWIRVSLDAGGPAQYKRVHGMDEGEFKKVLMNISLLTEAKRAVFSDVTIGVGYLTPGPEEDMRECALLCRDLGVDYVQFRPMLKLYDDTGGTPQDESDIIQVIESISEEFNHNGFQVLCSKHKYEGLDKGRQYGRCYGHHFTAVIAADKKLYLCCHLRGVEKYCIGDLKNNTLQEIWASDHRKEVYENLDLGDCPLFCRCDSFNKILWNIKRKRKHINFL